MNGQFRVQRLDSGRGKGHQQVEKPSNNEGALAALSRANVVCLGIWVCELSQSQSSDETVKPPMDVS